MPTILRFRGFNFVIYTFDHGPAHVHAKGRGVQAIFLLNCEGGPIEERGRYGATDRQISMLIRFIEANRIILCKAWEELHGNAAEA